MKLSTTSVAEAMGQAVAEVFEAMAFMEAQNGTDEHQASLDQPVFYTRLPVYKPSPAVVGLVFPRDMAATVAEAMMMREIDPEEDEFDIMDLLSEVTNTLAGSLLTHLMPEEDSFELGLPECRVLGNGLKDKEWQNAQEFLFQIDGTGFQVTWEAS